MERLLDAALEGPFADRLVRRVVDRMLESPELEHVVEHVATSPKVRAALAHTTTSVAGEVAAQVRTHATALDDLAERTARALVRRRPAAPASPYGGVVTRGVAFALDVALLALAVLPAAAGAALVVALLVHPADWLTGAAVSLGWTLAAAAYFVFFWTAGGTPAMRLMRQRVVAANRDTPPSALRAVVRFFVLLFGPVTLLVSGVLMLLDNRRRGLHDMIAGTVVVSADRAAPVEAAPAALEATA
jgi:uncharacterized RDD family membrane protein YckC